MDNFFIRHSTRTALGTDWLLSGHHTVRGRVLHCGDEKIAELPFVPTHFHVLRHEYLLLDAEGRILLMNRASRELQDVGQVGNAVLSVSMSRDEKWCVIATNAEILLFDTYIEFKASADVCLDRLVQIEWTDYNLFAVMAEDCVFFYDTELRRVGECRDRYLGMSWKSTYNVFACSTPECIRFIEPNGLEHGEPLQVSCDRLSFFDCEDVLAVMTHGSGEALLRIYYTRNFHWYQKAVRRVSGRFVCIEDNTVLFRSDKELTRLFVFREKTRCGPEYYVVDGNAVLYTDFSERTIPPPFYAARAVLAEEVVDVCPAAHGCIVLLRQRAVVFEIRDDEFVVRNEIALNWECSSVTRVGDLVLFKGKDGFLARTIAGEAADLPEELSSRVVRCYGFNGTLHLLLEDGSLVAGKTLCSGVDLKREFEVFVDSRVIVLSNGMLCVDGERTRDVTSFLASEHSLVVTTDETCRFYFEGRESCCQIDPGMRLLCMAGSRVVGETRHGTLETFTPRIYTLALVRRLLDAGRYEEAVDGCQRHVVSFDVFLDAEIDFGRFVSSCRNAHLVSFFNEALERLGGWRLVLESEWATRFRAVFNSEEMFRDASREHFEGLIAQDESIEMAAVAHLLGTEDGGEKREEDAGTLCGRSRRTFFNRLLGALDLERNLTFVLFLFVKMKRADLALRTCRHRLREGVGYMLTIANVNMVIHAAMKSFDRDVVLEVLRICQKDASDFLALEDAWSGDMLRFKICDFLEDRTEAFRHLSRLGLDEEEYVWKHGLGEEALMYETCGLSARRPGFYYELCAGLFPAQKAFVLFGMAGNRKRAFETAEESLFWRDAVELYEGEDRSGFCEELAARLVDADRRHEAAQLAEEFVGDAGRAFAEYVAARSMRDALRLCCDAEHLRRESRACLRERLLALDNLERLFAKYTERLKTVEERTEDCLSETSFSYSQNMRKSKRSTRLRDRPGGRYEREFILDRIRTIALDLLVWRDRNEDLLDVFRALDMEDCVQAHRDAFCRFRTEVGKAVDEIFDAQKRLLYDPNRPVVEKPDLSRWT